MYPNLRYAFYDLFGMDIPALGLIQSFGLCLALAFIVAGYVLMQDLKRRENIGLMQGIEEKVLKGALPKATDYIIALLTGFLVGFKGVYALFNSSAFTGDKAAENLLSLDHGYWWAGVLLAGGLTVQKYLQAKAIKKEYPEPVEESKLVLPHERVPDIVMVAAISGVIGAKLLYMTEADFSNMAEFKDNLFSGSGLTIYGGLILATLVVTYYARSKKIQIGQLIDAAAPAMILAYGVGRLGCHFSGDGDWGDPNPYAKPFSFIPDWMWGYTYPNNVIREGIAQTPCNYPADFGNYCTELPAAVYPTPIFELTMCILIFLFLWKLRHHVKTPGIIFASYMVFNGLERFSIEIIRINPDYGVQGFSLSQAQYIAIALMIAGSILSLILWRKEFQLRKADTADN